MQKLRIKRQSNCIRSGTVHLGHPVIKRPLVQSIGKSKQIKDPKQGQFKVVRENNGYFVQCTSPYIYHFPNFPKISGAMPLAGHYSIHQIWACAHLFGTPVYSIYTISSIFDDNTWSKNFKMRTFFFFLKSVNSKHTLFELMSRWSVHQHPPRERLHPGRETWLRTVERTSASSKMQSQSKNTKKKYKKRDH